MSALVHESNYFPKLYRYIIIVTLTHYDIVTFSEKNEIPYKNIPSAINRSSLALSILFNIKEGN